MSYSLSSMILSSDSLLRLFSSFFNSSSLSSTKIKAVLTTFNQSIAVGLSTAPIKP